MTVCIPRPRFHLHVFCFFFFLPAFFDFGRQILLLWTVYILFTHCAYTVHVLKNIKNGSHNTIYTFKYYFATVFSVFSFQFLATISSIQTHPICKLLSSKKEKEKNTKIYVSLAFLMEICKLLFLYIILRGLPMHH